MDQWIGLVSGRHPDDCKWWEYEHVPNYDRVLFSELLTLQTEVEQKDRSRDFCLDSRFGHFRLFRSLVPMERFYLAGNYRGQNFRCLRHLQVQIKSDPRVGCRPDCVLEIMRLYKAPLSVGFNRLDSLKTESLDEDAVVLQVLEFAAVTFEHFLRIHPYANGNGHIARMIVQAICTRYGFPLVRWTIEPGVKTERYYSSILACRAGNPRPLVDFLLDCA